MKHNNRSNELDSRRVRSLCGFSQALLRVVPALVLFTAFTPYARRYLMRLKRQQWIVSQAMFRNASRAVCMLACAVIFVVGWVSASAQDYRAGVTGSVVDAQGASVIGAKVVLHNEGTGVDTSTASDKAGSYVLNFVDPGDYLLSVEAPGFQRWEMRNLRLDTAQQVKVNVSLKVSEASASVTVVSSNTILETADANVTQLFDTRDLRDLPIPDGDPAMLLQLMGGSVWWGNRTVTRLADNGAITEFYANGFPGPSMFYLNGIPDNGVIGGNQGMAFIPPTDATDQVKIQSTWYNAADGFTGGASVNFNTKSGANTPHGSVYEYFGNEALNARTWTERHLDDRISEFRTNHFGGTFGGPVIIPHLYNGRNKTFFFVFSDHIRDYDPNPTEYVVPTQKMRTGDLSEICTAGFNASEVCNNISQQIYNPFSATATSGGHVTRQPFLNNKVSSTLINPITSKYLSYYPLPNIPGVAADGSANFFSENVQVVDYDSFLVRLDHYIGSKQHLAGDYFVSHRSDLYNTWPGAQNGISQSAGTSHNINHGFGITDTITLSPSTVLDARLGFNRFEIVYTSNTAGFDLGSMGFPDSVIHQFSGTTYFPRFTSTGLSSIGGPAIHANPSNEYSAAATLIKSIGSHLVKFGYAGMLYRTNYASPGNNLGTYAFNGNYAAKTDTSADIYGTGMVDMLVGQPTGGSIDVAASYANQVLYHGAFIQDEWKVNPKLTISAGLRYEFEGAPTERFNRNTRGFDLTSPNPVQASAQAAWTADFPAGLSVGPGLPVKTSFSALGGYTYTSSKQRSFFNPDHKVFMPRIGVAYSPQSSTVLRGGVGLYKSPLVSALGNAPGSNQTGFSQTTTLVPTLDNGLTFVANINNPFPNGVVAPAGSSLGLSQGLGSSVSFFPLNPPTSYVMHWSAEVQQLLPGKWLMDLVYLGSKGWHLPNSANNSNLPDAVPEIYFSTMKSRDTTRIGQLTTTVKNPFQGTMGPKSVNSTALNTGSTTTVYQLLRPMPQFTAVSTTPFNSTIDYNSLQVRLLRRFAHGYSFNAIYTWSKTMQRINFLNDFQAIPTRSLAGYDAPHHLVATFVAELPFGRGRRWMNSLPGWADSVLGGWQTSGMYQVQDGEPLNFGNVYYSKDPSHLHFHYNSSLVGTGTPMLDTSGFYFPTDANGNAWTSATAQRADSRISLSYNIPYFPRSMGNTRGPGYDNIDLAARKKFRITERVSANLDVDLMNALNHPWFSNPVLTPSTATFGTLSGVQQNNSRAIRLVARISF